MGGISTVSDHYNISSNFESFRFTHSVVLVNLHNDCCHVVAAESLARGDVVRAAIVQELRHCSLHLTQASLLREVVLVELKHHEVDCLLAGLDVPDAVTSEEHKLDVAIDGLD